MANVNITLHVQAQNLFLYPGGITDGPVLDHCSISDDRGGGPEQRGCLFFFLPPHPVKDHTTLVAKGDLVTWIPNSLDPDYTVTLEEIRHVKSTKPTFWIAQLVWLFFGLGGNKNFFKIDRITPSATNVNGQISKEIDYSGSIYDYEIRFKISQGQMSKEYTVHPRLKM